jgi:hypothetical protein
MVAFTGKIPSLKPATPVVKSETPPAPVVAPKPTTPIPSTLNLRIPTKEETLEAENKRLKEKITKLELKIQIDEHYQEGTSKNDKEYIAKMESTIKSQKSIIHSLSIQVQELQKEFGKVANVNSQ